MFVAGSALRADAPQSQRYAALTKTYCVACHNDKAKTGGLSLQSADVENVPKSAETWETVIRKIRTGAMPPQGVARPPAAELDGFASYLETSLDRAAAAKMNPGRSPLRRLNRAEYSNAIRDLLDLEIDVSDTLPADDESNGFDNIADALRFSPSLMEHYLSASWNISRLAVGNPQVAPSTSTYRVRPDLSQDQHIEGLPLGSRGGIAVRHNFPVDGDYVLKARLWRNTFDLLRGMEDPHEIEIAMDGVRLTSVTIGGHEDFVKMAANPGEFGAALDQKLTVKTPVKAGPHMVTATTILRSHAVRDDLIKPFIRTTIDGLDITGDPSMDRLTIEGPSNPKGANQTPSQKRIFVCHTDNQSQELPCARKILTALAQHAYRRPVKDADMEQLLSFYQRGRNNKGNFEAGIESALQLVLANPEFLFRFEDEPAGAPGGVYRIDDIALASRLSFFLWSTIPDDQLMSLAVKGKLKDPAVLDAQVRRMLADPKANALVDNFAEQWLFLRNLKNSAPNMTEFPDFDDNLRQAMKEETKLFFLSIMHEDRSIIDLLNADYTFINERLARHYGIPNIYGSQFQRVTVTDPRRRGLLGQASILTVTSYPNRTSPVQRGKWILTNILGTPPTPPPPGVPELKESGANAPTTLRERMEAHRADAVCAGCHKVMDPIGFSLENFDAIGRWRTSDEGSKIDPSGVLYNGMKVSGPEDLRAMLTARPENFAGIAVERLLTYGIGRGLDYSDMPMVRKIVSQAAGQNFHFSALILGIVDSPAFQMKERKTQIASR